MPWFMPWFTPWFRSTLYNFLGAIRLFEFTKMEHLRHYVFEPDGQLREFTHEAGARVANGDQALPEYADTQLRYLQVAVEDESDENAKVQVRMAAAMLSFNSDGFLTAAEPYDGDMISEFEREALAEFALAQSQITDFTVH